MNEKRMEILTKCESIILGRTPKSDIVRVINDEILQICNFFKSNPYDETFTDIPFVASFFYQIGGFLVEEESSSSEESSSYHIFIEDKE